MNRLPDYLTKAVSEDKSAFILFSYEDKFKSEYDAISLIIKPKLKKLKLIFFETHDISYVTLGYDPEYGYDCTMLLFMVNVPKEL